MRISRAMKGLSKRAVYGVVAAGLVAGVGVLPAEAVFYTAIWQGNTVNLTNVTNRNVEDIPDATLIGQVTNFQTDNPSFTCLNGSALNVWTAPSVYGSAQVVHNGLQGPQCTYGTWTIGGGGGGGTPAISVSPTSVNFGTVGESGSDPRSVTVSNSGTGGTLNITGVSLTGSAAADYTTIGCEGEALSAGSNCTIEVVFTPSASGTRSATLVIASDAGNKNVSLTGVGDLIAPTTTFSVSNNAIVLSTQTLGGTVRDTQSGVDFVTVTFTPTLPTGASSSSATLACNSTRRSCSFTTPVPLLPGQYTVTAQATDLAGNEEFPGPSVSIIVV